LGRALFSGFASLHNASEGLAGIFLGAVRLGLMLILPAAFGISMVADPMVRFCLGDHWLAAVPVVQIMAIGGATAIVTHACGNLLNAVGRPNVTFYVGAVSTLVKLIGLLFLTRYFGLPGAAFVGVIANNIDLVLMLRLTLRRIGVSPWQLAACAVRPTVATAAMVAALWQLGMAWTPGSGRNILEYVTDAGIRSVLGAACYGMVLAGLWFAAGRPDGAERFALTLLQGIWRRIHHWQTISRYGPTTSRKER
jgi:lipopolysaccharide exporter